MSKLQLWNLRTFLRARCRVRNDSALMRCVAGFVSVIVGLGSPDRGTHGADRGSAECHRGPHQRRFRDFPLPSRDFRVPIAGVSSAIAGTFACRSGIPDSRRRTREYRSRDYRAPITGLAAPAVQLKTPATRLSTADPSAAEGVLGSWYRFRVSITDTSPSAAAIQNEAYRRLGPSGRVQVAIELSEAVRQTTVAGIRRRNPEYDDTEAWREFRRLVYGSESR
jgi:hypothetical protein